MRKYSPPVNACGRNNNGRHRKDRRNIYVTSRNDIAFFGKFFIPAGVLTIAAIGFVIFAMGHPEMSFPWDGWITGSLYGVYADAVVLLFILAFIKKATALNILTIIFELGAVFFLVQAILDLLPDGHANWCLPLALGLNFIAVFLNLAQIRKNKKDNANDQSASISTEKRL